MCEPDLSKATLYADSNRGIYIPQYFAQTVRRDMVTGVSDELYAILEKGPDHKDYWEAWTNVLDNTTIKDPQQGDCYLHQDGDLWIVPVEAETPEPPTVILGHQFRPFDRTDWDAFAGADEGSVICYLDNTVLIWSPKAGILSEIVSDEMGSSTQVDWKRTEIG